MASCLILEGVSAREYDFSISSELYPDLIAIMSDESFAANDFAGSKGYVIADGDELYFENGDPAKFWGVGVTFSRNEPVSFPPTKDRAEEFAKKLKLYGFNLVRFVGIDNSLRPLCKYWQQKGEFGGEMMDRLDYLISMLVENGIYYSFSINNSSLCPLESLDNSPVNTHPKPWKRYHGLRLIYPEMLSTQVGWISDFFSHKNSYTGKTYAEDPANVYFSTVNEDSVWDVYFRGGKYLSSKDREWLDKNFNNWKIGHLANVANDQRGSGAEGESFQKEALLALNLWKPKWLLSLPEKKIIYTYLTELDSALIISVRGKLKDLGYRGLITATNNWYGYGALHNVVEHGDYVEMHGYFDHPVSWKGDQSRFSGKSFLKDQIGKEWLTRLGMKDWSFPLSKSIRSALINKPLIIGEWNHAAWSPYAYEGPFLIYSFSSMQGYSGVVSHTWFPYPASKNGADVQADAFAVSENPILLRLNPVFSAGWFNECLLESNNEKILPLGDSVNGYIEKVFDVGLGSDLNIPVEQGFESRVRVEKPKFKTMSGGGLKEGIIENSEPGSVMVNPRNGILRFEGSCVLGAAFSEPGTTVFSNGISVKMEKKGGVAAVALDKRDVGFSADLLIALVGSPVIQKEEYIGHWSLFRLPAGVSVSAGEVRARLGLPKTESCPVIHWLGDHDDGDGVYARYLEGGVCELEIISDNGAWIRIKENELMVSMH